MKKIIFCFIASFFFLSFQITNADEKIISTITDKIDGDEIFSGDLTCYIKKDKARWDEIDGAITIVRLDKNTVIRLAPGNKTYVEVNINELKKLIPGTINATINFNHTNITDKIGKYECRKSDAIIGIMGLPCLIEAWSTKDIEIEQTTLDFVKEFDRQLGEHQPSGIDIKMMKAFCEKGLLMVSCKIEIRTSFQETPAALERMSILKSFSREKLDDSLFDVPEGYKKQNYAFFDYTKKPHNPAEPIIRKVYAIDIESGKLFLTTIDETKNETFPLKNPETGEATLWVAYVCRNEKILFPVKPKTMCVSCPFCGNPDVGAVGKEDEKFQIKIINTLTQ